MSRFVFQGVQYEVVKRPTFAEFAWVEDQAKIAIDDMSGMRRIAAMALLSLRRSGVLLTWSDIMEVSPDDFDWVEDGEGDSDPSSTVTEPPDVGEEGPSKSRKKSTSSSSSSTSD